METIDEDAPDDFEVWPENEASLTLFLRMNTQWDMSDGRVTRLNYAALNTVMDIFATPDKQQAFLDVQIMENAALVELRKR